MRSTVAAPNENALIPSQSPSQLQRPARSRVDLRSTRPWLVALVLCARGAAAQPPPPHSAEVDAALAQLAAAAPGDARLAAAQAVIDLGAPAADALIARLGRARPSSSSAERRAVLGRFHADVPLPDGRWVQPPRPKKGEKPKEPNWLEELARLDDRGAAVTESLEIVVVIRALAATREERAATAILDFAFSDDGLVFRDECGRFLRNMAPWSLATLLRASGEKKRAGGSYARYATYQLDRMDKGRPTYVLAAAPNDEVEVAILHAIRDVKHPDAVTAVLERCDDSSAAVRKAAREAWMAYVTGPAPPEAPKRPRKLPGGKLTKPLPLYLTYRELAVNELKRVLTEVEGTAPPKELKVVELTERLFAIYDQRRTAVWDETMNAAAELAKAGKWTDAAAKYDTILITDPFYARRAEMAPVYLEVGRAAAAESRWDDAALAFDRAYSLDPEGPNAAKARAELHYARAQALRARGQSAEDELAQALAADPGHEGARSTAKSVRREQAKARRGWILYAGLGTGLAALALLGWGVVARRRG